LAVQFLQQGFARTIEAASRSEHHADELFAAEQHAKQARLNLWQVYKEENQEPDEEFKQETINMKVTEIMQNGVSFYFQTVGDSAIGTIETRMKEFDGESAPAVTDARKDLLCATIFAGDNSWHRVRIVGRTKHEGEWRVSFLDYGNVEIVHVNTLRQLPEDLASMPGLARLGVLAGCRAPNEHKKDHARRAMDRLTELIYQHPVTARIEAKKGSTYCVTVFGEGSNGEAGRNINQELVETGFVALDNSKNLPRQVQALVEELAQYQEIAKSNGLGVWQQADDDSEEENNGRANGRQKGGRKK